MKKFSILLIALLGIAHVSAALGCIGWAKSLVKQLRNKNGYCSGLPTQEEVEKCYEFKREYAEFWHHAVSEFRETNGLDCDIEVLLESLLIVQNNFNSYDDFIKVLVNAQHETKENVHKAEDCLANVAIYHAEKSQDQSFGRKDIVFIGNTQAGQNTPKCR
jgi:hypothetical protein